VQFIRRNNSIDISGWYDNFVGIESEIVTLKEFFERCGITKKDCTKAFEE